MPRLAVTASLSIDEAEIAVAFTRAGGPGGQNVNKVETAVELRFDVWASPSLDAGAKERLTRLAGRRLTDGGVLVIFAQRHRTQERNRADARARLLALIAAAAERPRPRVKTRPTRASQRRRVEGKIKRGAVKRGRNATADD